MIPARDEEQALPSVLSDLPSDVVDTVIVADNGSSDATAAVARLNGAVVVSEPRPGYGWACMAGILEARRRGADIVLFLDGDYADHPEQAADLIRPIVEEDMDLVIGSRTLGRRERGALLPQARIGNWIACGLIRLIWGVRYTDLGPFRAVKMGSLLEMDLREMRFGWTVEMQIRAARQGLSIAERPVDYRRRIGTSKVTGTLIGTIKAGFGILSVIFREALRSTPVR